MAPPVVVARLAAAPAERTVPIRRTVLLVALGVLAALVAVGVGGVVAARTLAERQAVNDSAATADLLAEAVAQPALQDGITTGDRAATTAFASAISDYLASTSIVRVKLWSATGTILYSDEPRLIGSSFKLGLEEQEVLSQPRIRAEVSDLDKPENLYERGRGKLLEAYRPVWTPSGTPLLFEIYLPYDEVNARAGQLWRGFAGVTVTSLLVLMALLVPLVWQLASRLRSAQRQREELLRRSVEASADERRRIAGTLHDGVVQELAATAFTVGAVAERADEPLAADLRAAAATLRDSIGGLRTLLIDIYPQSLRSAGLVAVLSDLAATVRSRGVTVHLDLPDADIDLGADADQLVFRVAHECLQNVARHSSASNLWLSLRRDAGSAVLRVADDGVGFDAAQVLARPPEGHFGLRVLADLAAGRADLTVASAPGAGCTWTLTVPAR